MVSEPVGRGSIPRAAAVSDAVMRFVADRVPGAEVSDRCPRCALITEEEASGDERQRQRHTSAWSGRGRTCRIPCPDQPFRFPRSILSYPSLTVLAAAGFLVAGCSHDKTADSAQDQATSCRQLRNTPRLVRGQPRTIGGISRVMLMHNSAYFAGKHLRWSRFELMAAECAAHDVTRMAQLLGVSTSGYYTHLQRLADPEPTPAAQRRRDLEVKIAAHHKVSGASLRLQICCGVRVITVVAVPTGVIRVIGLVVGTEIHPSFRAPQLG